MNEEDELVENMKLGSQLGNVASGADHRGQSKVREAILAGMSKQEPFKAGSAALIGPPNAGKSTLLNRLLGQKISIVSPKPQTTRNRIMGVVNGPGYQLVLLDTPGIHRASGPLNSGMVNTALAAINEVDMLIFMIDATEPIKTQAETRQEAARLLGRAKLPTILACNKTDRLAKPQLLPLIASWQEVYSFTAVVPISARSGEGVEALLAEAVQRLDAGEPFFPDDLPTDASERFIVSEIIREKIFLLTGAEIPYATAVVIELFKEDEERGLTTIHASILVEKDSQKGIIIGRGGAMLKKIGQTARREIETLLASRVLLKLWVKVERNWSKNPRMLTELGFDGRD